MNHCLKTGLIRNNTCGRPYCSCSNLFGCLLCRAHECVLRENRNKIGTGDSKRETDRVIERDTDRLDGEGEGMWINDKLHLSFCKGVHKVEPSGTKSLVLFAKLEFFGELLKSYFESFIQSRFPIRRL